MGDSCGSWQVTHERAVPVVWTKEPQQRKRRIQGRDEWNKWMNEWMDRPPGLFATTRVRPEQSKRTNMGWYKWVSGRVGGLMPKKEGEKKKNRMSELQKWKEEKRDESEVNTAGACFNDIKSACTCGHTHTPRRDIKRTPFQTNDVWNRQRGSGEDFKKERKKEKTHLYHLINPISSLEYQQPRQP